MLVSSRAARREPLVAVHQLGQCCVGAECALRASFRRECEFRPPVSKPITVPVTPICKNRRLDAARSKKDVPMSLLPLFSQTSLC